VLLDGEQGLPEFAGLFVLGHVRGLLEPDELLPCGRVQLPVVLLCTTGGGDVIVPALLSMIVGYAQVVDRVCSTG
jgi:hypothetical protein